MGDTAIGKDDGDHSDEAVRVLRERFGFGAFKPWQREAIDAVLGQPRRALVVAPTGGGKSLTFQLPAVMLPGTALVVSPLVALMEDQSHALEQRGIAATWLSSTVAPDERRLRIGAMLRGRYKLVYVAPERLQYDGFVEILGKLPLSLVAVDEAHCIAMWGHDFRPDYLRIGALIERLKPTRLVACTATATPEVRREILERLGLEPETVKVILRGFARPNLHLAARNVEGPTQSRELVSKCLRTALGSPMAPRGGGIVYAATRKNTERLTESLRADGWNARAYHAGLEADVRSEVSLRFAERSLDLVVATNAFGMGIDRADIRVVVHQQPPASIEAYYQEVGRAGRDGNPARGLLLCSGGDIALRRRLCERGADGEPAPADRAAKAWRSFRDLLRYLDAGTCRHDFVLRYFGDEHETLGGCGHCDVCATLDEASTELGEDTGRVVRIALSAVARANGRAGMQSVAEMLRGHDSPRVRRFGFASLSTFGLLGQHGHEWILSLLRRLIAAGWIDLTPTEHPVPVVTRAGWAVMKSQDPIRLCLPSSERRRATAASPTSEVGPLDAALFERLKVWRSEVARRNGWPAYVIAFDSSLRELAVRRPTRTEELGRVPGFGPARVEAWGEAVLAIVRGE